MQFINPGILFALSAVLIPIAIHLFNFRKYRKVYFSNVSFLKDLQQKSQKQSQLLHLLVLLMRVLAIAALVIAFARPYIPSASKSVPGRRNVISIFVDNSFSMEAAASQGRLIDQAKTKATEIVSAYKPDDVFQLLTNDFDGRHQRLVSKEEFLEMLPDVNVSPAVRTLGEIASRQQDLLATSRSASKSAYIISDFQRSTVMTNLPADGPGYITFLVPLVSAGSGNLYIDTCWFEDPVAQLNRTSILHVRVKNASDGALEKIPLKLTINGRQRAVASLNIGAHGSAEVSMPFINNETGFMHGTVEINDYPVTYDDVYYFVFKVSGTIPVLVINSGNPNPYLGSVFSLDSVLSVTQVNTGKTDYSSFPDYRLIILNDLKSVTSGSVQELTRFVSNGGSLLIFPAFDADKQSVNQLLSALKADQLLDVDSLPARVTEVNTQSPVFSNVFEKSGLDPDLTDLPGITRHFRFSSVSTVHAQTLLRLANGDPLFSMQTMGQGKVYLSAVPAVDQGGNWPRHALFVPAMLNIAFASEDVIPMMYYTGTTGGIAMGNLKPEEDNLFRLSGLDGKNPFIPEYRQSEGQGFIYLNGQISEAGIYKVSSGKNTLRLLAFDNDRRESDLSLADQKTLTGFTEKVPDYRLIEAGPRPLNEVIASENSGKRLWKWFILTALLCIIAEESLLRYAGKSVNSAKAR